MTCDIFNLILQGLGGGISSTQQHPKGIQAGINIVIAGLVSQVVSLSIFMICCAHFAFRVFRSVEKPVQIFSHIRDTKSFQSFLIGELFLLISLASPITDNGLPSRYRLGHNLHLHAFQLQNSRAQTRVHWTSCQQRSSFHGMYFSSNFLMQHLISVDSGRWHDLNRNYFSDLAAPRPLLSKVPGRLVLSCQKHSKKLEMGEDHTSENSKQPNVTIHELHSRLDSLLHTERSRVPSAYHVLDR